jgi:hypothetical protein
MGTKKDHHKSGGLADPFGTGRLPGENSVIVDSSPVRFSSGRQLLPNRNYLTPILLWRQGYVPYFFTWRRITGHPPETFDLAATRD